MGWLPRGVISTEPLKDIVRRVTPSGLVGSPEPLGSRVRLRHGEPRGLRAAGSPKAELADAVAASCAIPGFYYPVEIGGRRYVDGGIRSTSNLDMLRGHDLDLVICLNPTSSRHPPRARNPPIAAARVQPRLGKRLGSEAKALRRKGRT